MSLTRRGWSASILNEIIQVFGVDFEARILCVGTVLGNQFQILANTVTFESQNFKQFLKRLTIPSGTWNKKVKKNMMLKTYFLRNIFQLFFSFYYFYNQSTFPTPLNSMNHLQVILSPIPNLFASKQTNVVADLKADLKIY